MAHFDNIQAGFDREVKDSEYDIVASAVCNCSDEHDTENSDCPQNSEDGWFSKASCDICNSGLGGSRYNAALIIPGKGPEHYIALEVCTCCYLAIENGEACDCE